MLCLELFRDKHVIVFSSAVFIAALFCSLFISIFVGALFFLSLISGILLPFIFFRDRKHVPNLLALFTGSTRERSLREYQRSCSICGGEECSRQHLGLSNSTANAHINFTIPQSVDEALEELLNLVLDHHIYSWYKEITVHDQLADEIRFLIRYVASSLGTRLCKIDLTNVILNRLIPAGLSHLDAYVEGSKRARGNASVDSSVISYLKSMNGLHKALESREEETNYLRGIIATIYPFVIPIKYKDSSLAKVFLEELLGRFLILQGLDLLADPDTINLLFLLLFSAIDSDPWLPSPEEPKVLILKAFASVNTHSRNSVLRSNLSAVLKDQSQLYLFHNFLKEEGSINILSFCLAVEDFNRHILVPDLCTDQLECLHKEAVELYHTFMSKRAIAKLHFQPEIVAEIREIIHSEVSDIIKLRTTSPLFQAYEYAYNLLEREYLPLFMNSNAYFAHICGSKNSQNHQRNSSNSGSPCKSRDGSDSSSTHRRNHSVSKAVVHKVQQVGSGLASIGRQITLRPCVVNGDEDMSHINLGIDEASDITSFLKTDECIGTMSARSPLEGLAPAFRDLSAWRVCIPKVEHRTDANGKMSFIFIVDVTRIDVSGDNPDELHWEVERRYHEFYILEAKLTEFHGEFTDNVLPPRKSLFTSKGINFMHSRLQIFEEFLQKLLQKPSLKGSQLLFLFLKTKDEFTPSYLPDVSLGRFLKEVPRKLIKERGQNLDAFVTNFIAKTSYDSSKNVLCDFDDAILGDVSAPTLYPEDEELLSSIYKDNANSLKNITLESPSSPPLAFLAVSGVFETILYVAVRLYGLSQNCVRWLMAFKALVGNTIDAAITFFLRKKLGEALAPPRLVKLIHLIRDALFFDPPLHRSELERMMREKEIRRAVVNLVPKWIQNLMFTPELYDEGANSLVNFFQHPVLNKQLSYVLLDIILEELFPEICLDSEQSKLHRFSS